jgi:hypothetical protein
MRRLLLVATFNLLLLFFGATALGQSTETAAVKALAEKSGRAFMSGDYETLLDLTYPKLVELAGGREYLLSSMKAEMKRMSDTGIKFVAYTPSEPERIVRAGTKLLAVVPTALEMEAPEASIKHKSFLLAVSTDAGKSWTFIDGTKLDKERLKILLPEAVDKITLPTIGEPVIERKPPRD